MKLTLAFLILLVHATFACLLLGAEPPITALAFTPNGGSVLVGSQAGLAELRWPDLQRVRAISTDLSHIHAMAFAPNGKILAVVGGSPATSGGFELLDWPDGGRRRGSPHRDLIHDVSWRFDSLEFATASADQTIGVHSAVTGQTVRVLPGHSRAVLSVAFLPDELGLLSAGIDETVRLWNSKSGMLERTLSNHTRPVLGLAVKPSRNQDERLSPPVVASISLDRTVRLWQPTLGRLMRFVRLPSPPLSVAWSRDGATIVTTCRDGHVRVIDPSTVEVLEDLPALDGVAHSLAIASDGTILVGGENGQLRHVRLARRSP